MKFEVEFNEGVFYDFRKIGGLTYCSDEYIICLILEIIALGVGPYTTEKASGMKKFPIGKIGVNWLIFMIWNHFPRV